ncbi:MAG: hypothetical protein WA874_14575 [Chryseosolibacter sp.]
MFSDLASTAADDDDQGAVQVDGSTGAYFYAFDETGEQAGYQSLNHVLRLPPGRYQVRVNNAQWPVEVQSGRLARCATGTVLLTGSTADLFQVSDSTGNPLGAETLGKSMSFFPGAYTVKVNNTEAAVVVKPMQLTVVKTGTLVVHGDTGEFYYVLNSADDQLNNNIFERPLAFLPGTYPVKVNKTTRNAEVFAGQVTELSTGTVLVKGMTEEHYYVTDTLGSALNYQRLNKALAFFPGPVHIRINNTMMNGLVSAGQTSEFITGSLMLTGGGTEYYYVLDDQGNSLNYNALNKSLSLFPADYVVKIGGNMRRATVNPGQLTTIDAFE